jgi:hypothetical protein
LVSPPALVLPLSSSFVPVISCSRPVIPVSFHFLVDAALPKNPQSSTRADVRAHPIPTRTSYESIDRTRELLSPTYIAQCEQKLMGSGLERSRTVHNRDTAVALALARSQVAQIETSVGTAQVSAGMVDPGRVSRLESTPSRGEDENRGFQFRQGDGARHAGKKKEVCAIFARARRLRCRCR